MNKNPSKVFAVLVWSLSAFVSGRYAAGYWVVGPVFALAVLGVNAASLRRALLPKYLMLAAASTLIYAGVFYLGNKGWKFHNDWQDMLFGGLSAGVVFGSLLMPSVQALLFKLDFKAAQRTAFYLILSWYFIILTSGIEGTLGLGLQINYISISVALWQGIYLYRLKLSS